jgi:hypothetical protein
MAQRKRNPGAIRDLESIVNPATGDITTTGNITVNNATVCGALTVEDSITMAGTQIRHPVRFGPISLATNAVVPLTTSVESWAGNIDLTVVDMSTSTVAPPILQLGTLTGLVTSGYGGGISKLSVGSTVTGIANDNGFRLSVGHSATRVIQAQLSLIKHGTATSNTWSIAMKGGMDDLIGSFDMGGSVTLPGALTTLSLRTTSGTATEVYDGGTVAGVIRY